MENSWRNEEIVYTCHGVERGECSGCPHENDECPARLYVEVIGDGERTDFANEIPPLKRIVELAPHFGQAWCNLGICQFEVGQLRESRDSLMRAARHVHWHEKTRNCWIDINSRLADLPGQDCQNLTSYLSAIAVKLGDLPCIPNGKPGELERDAGRDLANYLHDISVRVHQGERAVDVSREVEAAMLVAISKGAFDIMMLLDGYLRIERCGLFGAFARLKPGQDVTKVMQAVVSLCIGQEYDHGNRKPEAGWKVAEMLLAYAFVGATEALRWAESANGNTAVALKLIRRGYANAYCFGHELGKVMMKSWQW